MLTPLRLRPAARACARARPRSWDYTVRVWGRGELECRSVFKFDDWVHCVAARGGLLLVSAGAEVLVHDVASGALLRNFQNLHAGEACALEGSRSGRLLFTGGQDGLVIAHDLRMRVRGGAARLAGPACLPG